MPIVLSLDKSIAVLEAVMRSPDGVGTRAMAHELGYNVATIHNIATTFCRRGFLRQDATTRRFFPGLRLMMMGRHPSYLRSLTASAGDTVDALAARLNESVLLGAIDHGRVLNLRYVPSRQALRVQEPEDVSDHSYCTAFGKVLLATMTEAELDLYLRETRLEALTPRTFSTPERLREELRRVREQGYAQTRDEYCEGVSAVAVPIHDPWGSVIASLGASAPTVRMDKPRQFEESLAAVKAAAAEIERVWGRTLQDDVQARPAAGARKPGRGR